MEERQEFYKAILDSPAQDDSREVVRLIRADENCGFFELCQEYIRAALDSKTWFSGDMQMETITPYIDTNRVIDATLAFIRRYDLNNPEQLLHMIKYRFAQSMSIHDHHAAAAQLKEWGIEQGEPLDMAHFIHLHVLTFWDEISNRVLAA